MKFLSRFAILGFLIILLSNEINQSDAELLARKFEETVDLIVDEYQYKKRQENAVDSATEKNELNSFLSSDTKKQTPHEYYKKLQQKNDVFIRKNYYRKRRNINDTDINLCRDKNKVKSILNHLDEGEKLIKYAKDTNVVLVLGNTGAGKSTFVQYLAGDNSNLFSVEVMDGNESTGDFIIQDTGNKIGKSSFDSHTELPELIIDGKTNTSIYDCPGFSDTRDAQHDIAGTYYIKKIINRAKAIKFIFIVNYNSVKKGQDKTDFMELARHAINMIKNINKFKDSIAIIATKVNDIKADNKIISTIRSFLTEAKNTLSKKINKTLEDEKIMQFVDILLTNGSNNNDHTRIGFIRQPTDSGSFSTMESYQEHKASLENLLHKNIKFIEYNEANDFGYTISAGSQNCIHYLIQEIYNSISFSTKEVAKNVQIYYDILVQSMQDKINSFLNSTAVVNTESSEPSIFLASLDTGYNIIFDLIEEIKIITTAEELSNKIVSRVKSLNGDIFVNVSEIVNQAQYLDFLGNFSSQNFNSFDSLTWISPFQSIIINLEQSKRYINGNATNIGNQIKNRIRANAKDIGVEIKKYLDYKEKTIYDIQTLNHIIEPIYNRLSETIKAADVVDQINKCTRIISDNVHVLNITDTEINNSTKYISSNTVKYGVYLDFVNALTYQSNNNLFKCADGLSNIESYLSNSTKFYRFLFDLYKRLSDYDIQNNTGRCHNYLNEITQSKEIKKVGDIISQEFLNRCYREYINSHIRDIILNQSKLDNLNKVLDLTLKSNALKSCDYAQGNKLVVKGNYVKLSDIQKHDCKTPLKSIEIYALKKVFIDVDMEETGKNLQLLIIAPTWDVQGTRQIILNGNPGKAHDSEKANDGTTVVAAGENGKPGLPGNPGGNFLGIGVEVINAQDLTVISNGGKGGPGQSGGNGVNGPNGISPPKPTDFENAQTLCKNCDGMSFSCSTKNGDHIEDYIMAQVEFKEITLHGFNGGLGGDGGDGGTGGMGGKPGNIIFIILSNHTRPHTSATIGAVGNDGDGGKIGMIGTDGSDITINEECNLVSEMGRQCFEKQKNTKPSAKNKGPSRNWPGTRGLNTAGRKESKEADKFENPSYSINNFKSYLRENLSESIWESELRDFLDRMENRTSNKELNYQTENSLVIFDNSNIGNSVSVSDLYDSFGFVNELNVLESQFPDLNKKIPFIPFYQSLFDRVNQYKEKIKNDTKFTESQKVLDYLLAAILSKICSMNNNLAAYLVIDVNKYFQSVEKHIKEYKNVQQQVRIDKYSKRYQNTVSTQIKEAIHLIENDILPEMDKIIDETNRNIHLLMNETISLQEKGNEEKKDLVDKMSQLQGQFVQEALLSVLKIGSVALALAGPVGAVAGASIGIVVTGYETSRPDNINTPTQVSTTLPPDLGQSFTRISDLIRVDQKKFEEQLNNAQIMLNEISSTDSSSNITKVKQKIQKTQDELKKITPEKLKDDPSLVTQIHTLKNKVLELTKNEKELVEKERSDNDPTEIKRKISENEKNIQDEQAKGATKDPASLLRMNELQDEKKKLSTKYSEVLAQEKPKHNIKTERYLNALTHIQNGVSVGNAVQDAYSKIKTHFSKVNEFEKSIKQATEKIEKLEKYKTGIYEIIIPMIEMIKSRYTDVRDNSRDKSHMSLDVIRWRIQSTFKDVQIQIREMTQGFQTQVGLTRCIEKFEYGVLAVIQMYDRIQDAYEKEQLGRYIANIHSGVPITNNEALNQEVNNLDLVTRSNLVLYEYGQAIDAFKQYIFPFAYLYLNQFDLKAPHNNLSDLVDEACQEMNTLIDEKDKRSSLIDSSNEADSYIKVVFRKKPAGAGEFVVWDHDMYHSEISSLLKGEEITINADITKAGLAYNAVKFNEIGIQFRLSNNNSLEEKMHQSLQHFTVEMTHLGNSYYKCGNKFYIITHSQQKIEHDALLQNGIYENFNEVYSKIVENPPLLSPYTMWKLKLSNKTETAFENLSEFVGQPIDLALIGKGKYVGTNHGVCNTNLDKYYKNIDISTIN